MLLKGNNLEIKQNHTKDRGNTVETKEMLINGLAYPSESALTHLKHTFNVRDDCSFTFDTSAPAIVTGRLSVASGLRKGGGGLAAGRHAILHLIYSVACKPAHTPFSFLPFGHSMECAGRLSHGLWLSVRNSPKETNR